MVILLCSTPRRGVVAVATHGTPSGCKRVQSTTKRPPYLYSSHCSPIGVSQIDLDLQNCSSRDQSLEPDLLDWLGADIDNRQRQQDQRDTDTRQRQQDHLLTPAKVSISLSVSDHSGLETKETRMTATPTYGHSCFPFAVNCRFSKTFIGVPKKCGYCQKIIVGTGFACQNCRFRCHKRCIMIGRGPQVCLRPKPCSLSRLPRGDEALINKLLRESEINSNDMDSVFTECEEDDKVTVTNGQARRPSRPSLANSTSIIRSIAPSLTTSDDPSSSAPSPPSASPSVSNPSSPTYPSNITDSSYADQHHLHPLSHQRRHPRPASVQQQQQHKTNMLLLALAAGVERRPSSSSSNTSSSKRRQRTNTTVDSSPAPTPASSYGLMGKFLKLIPPWNAAVNKEGTKETDNSDSMPRSCSVASAFSSASTAACSSVGDQQETDQKSNLPRAVSASGAVTSMAAGYKRPHALSACSTTSAYSASGGTRTPVDEFNSSILEDLFASSQTSVNATGKTGKSEISKPSQFLRRKLLWAKHMAGDRSARSQDCVNGVVTTNNRLLPDGKTSECARVKRSGSAVEQENGTLDNNTETGRLEGRSGEEGRLGFGRMINDHPDDPNRVHEPLANTWPLSGLHINHDNSTARGEDELGNAIVPEDFESCDAQECDVEDGLSLDTRRGSARLSDLGEWTIPYSDLELGECVNEYRNMTTYKGRWHGDVMIHTFDMTGAQSDRLMKSFLDNVRTLTKIRHENVALFMGASIEAPLVAVVTSIRKACSLYDAVHVENRRISQHVKLNIVRQIAQGMGYLHAKGIVLKTLSSRSIYLESKLKISTLDDGAPLKRHDVNDVGCVRRGHLTYISPELMQTIRVEPPALIVSGTPTKESDVYAFGTVLFELYAGHFPFAHFEPESIIWTIGTGVRQDLERVRCNVAMKSLIEDCWSPDPTYRPSFTEILKELHHTAALHKKHSSSVPDKLNKTGLNRSPYIY